MLRGATGDIEVLGEALQGYWGATESPTGVSGCWGGYGGDHGGALEVPGNEGGAWGCYRGIGGPMGEDRAPARGPP